MPRVELWLLTHEDSDRQKFEVNYFGILGKISWTLELGKLASTGLRVQCSSDAQRPITVDLTRSSFTSPNLD